MDTDETLNVLIQPGELAKATDPAAPGDYELGHAPAELVSGPVDAARAMGREFELVKKKIEETNVELDKMGGRAALAFSSIKANLFDAIRQETSGEAFDVGNFELYLTKIVDQARQANAAVAATAATRAQTEVENPVTAGRDQAIAGQIPADTSVCQSDQQRRQLLVPAASAGTGAQLDRAIMAIEAGAKDLGAFAGQVQQLGQLMAGFNLQLADLKKQMDELAHKQNQPQAQ